MSDGAIGGFIVITILIFFFFLFLYLDWPKYARYQSHATDDSYWNRINWEPNRSAFYPIPSDKDRHEHKHREIEQGYWVASIALSAVTIIIAFAAALFALFAYNTAEKQLDFSSRPYVGGPISVSIEHGSLYFDFRNVGHTPTKGLYIDVIYSSTERTDDISKDACKGLDEPVKTGNHYSAIPDSVWRINYNDTPYGIKNKADVVKAVVENPGFFIGCVKYGSPFDEVIHSSIFKVRTIFIDNKLINTAIYTQDVN